MTAPTPYAHRTHITLKLSQVLLLVWDDASNNLGLHPGLMATHDQETYAFFKGSKVKCVLCPRQGGSEDSLMQVCVCESVCAFFTAFRCLCV